MLAAFAFQTSLAFPSSIQSWQRMAVLYVVMRNLEVYGFIMKFVDLQC